MKKILVIGSLNMDFSIKTDLIPKIGETVIGSSFTLVPGGKGANQAYALGKLGANVSMLGMVGDDPYATALINNLNSVSVDTEKISKLKDTNTGVAFVTVDKTGDNSIIVISGANHKITKEYIELINNSDIIIMQLEIPLEVVSYVAKLAHNLGKTVILDPAPAINNLSEEIYQNVDIIKPNETELSTLTGIDIRTDDDIKNAAKNIINRGVSNVIVTLGGKGSILVNKEEIKNFSVIDVPVVDTTAAGDSFTAALAISLAKGENLHEAINYAHIVSSIVVTKEGAQSSIPTIDEINKFIKEREL